MLMITFINWILNDLLSPFLRMLQKTPLPGYFISGLILVLVFRLIGVAGSGSGSSSDSSSGGDDGD